MVKVALKRDRNIEREITKKSYELNKKAYILLDAAVQAPVKKSENPAAVEGLIAGKSKGGRPRKPVENEG